MTQTLLRDIEKWNEDFTQALRRGDLDQSVALFSEGARIVPPGSPKVVDSQTLTAYLKQLSQWTLEMKIQEVSLIEESVAREIGTLKLTKRIGSGSAQVPIHCQYLGIFEKVDNAWRRNCLIWNRAAPARAAGTGAGTPGPQSVSRPVFVPRIG